MQKNEKEFLFTNFFLFQLPKKLRHLISLFLVTLSFGVILGLVYVFVNTQFSPDGVQKHYGQKVESTEDEIESELYNELEQSQQYHEKGLKEILTTTHNHVLSLSVIFFIVSFLVYFTNINSTLKKILMFEPFISILVTFSGIWAVRYLDNNFKFIIIISSTILYLCYFISVFILLKELLFNRNINRSS